MAFGTVQAISRIAKQFGRTLQSGRLGVYSNYTSIHTRRYLNVTSSPSLTQIVQSRSEGGYNYNDKQQASTYNLLGLGGLLCSATAVIKKEEDKPEVVKAANKKAKVTTETSESDQNVKLTKDGQADLVKSLAEQVKIAVADSKFADEESKRLGPLQTRLLVNKEHIKTKFEDIKGNEAAKHELKQVADYLKDTKRYEEIGVSLPKGCLLTGIEGVGKTMLVQAFAAECCVPFYKVSGIEFNDSSKGTERIRDMFKIARKNTPCVIFFDDIDTMTNDVQDQLAAELQGFGERDNIFVIGASSDRKLLRRSLRCSGRFEIDIRLKIPSLEVRREILESKLATMKTDSSLDMEKLSKEIGRRSGADIVSICNHAGLKAISDGRNIITMEDIQYAHDKVKFGLGSKVQRIEDMNRYTAYHEAGHALVLYYCGGDNSTLLRGLSIIPRSLSNGHTTFVTQPRASRQSRKPDYLLHIDTCMGGRVAEEIIFGKDQVSAGARGDLYKASTYAEDMIMRYGFNDKFGMRVISRSKDQRVSEKMLQEMDEEINNLLKDSHRRVTLLLKSKRRELDLLAEALLDKEELTYDQVKQILEKENDARKTTV